MDAKHTPGPWIAGDDEDSDYFLIGPEEYPGLVTRPIVKLHCEADAKLIAAAPELLEALHRLEVSANTVAYCYSNNQGNFASALQQLIEDAKAAREVSAKATGQ